MNNFPVILLSFSLSCNSRFVLYSVTYVTRSSCLGNWACHWFMCFLSPTTDMGVTISSSSPDSTDLYIFPIHLLNPGTRFWSMIPTSRNISVHKSLQNIINQACQMMLMYYLLNIESYFPLYHFQEIAWKNSYSLLLLIRNIEIERTEWMNEQTECWTLGLE